MDSMDDRVILSQVERAAALAVDLRAIFGKLKRKLREQGERSDLTPSQVSVLLHLEKDGAAAVSSLARAEGMRPQSMSAITTSLLEAGLVSGSPEMPEAAQRRSCGKAGLAHNHNPEKALRSGTEKTCGGRGPAHAARRGLMSSCADVQLSFRSLFGEEPNAPYNA
jgi:MarR family